MKEEKLSGLSKELLNLLKEKKTLTINELLNWAKSKGASSLVLSTIIGELEEENLIKKIGKWEKSEPLFLLPEKIEIASKKEEKIDKKKEKVIKEEKIDEKTFKYFEKIKEYLAKYYSVGELRIRLDFSMQIKEIDPILRELEDKGLIVWDREIGTITATEKLVSEYKKSRTFLDTF